MTGTTVDFSDVFPDFIADRTKDFTGREWVFAAIDRWLADPSRRPVFLLSGRPGVGKSATMARLVQFSLGEALIPNRPNLDPGFIAHFHFCQAAKDKTLSSLRYIEALSQTLANRYQAFRDTLLSQQDQNVSIRVEQTAGSVVGGGQMTGVFIKELHIGGLNPRAAFDRAVRIPLETLCTTDFAGPIVLLVDSLDEALLWAEDDNIAALLAGVFDRSGNLPSQVCAILSSRNDEQIRRWYGRPALDLIDNTPRGAHDVQTYVYQQLSEGSEQQRRQIARRLDRVAKGNFLYARYTLNDITSKGALPALSTLPQRPSDLDGIYRTFIKRHLANSDKQWKQVRPLLGALVVARDNGLTQAQLHGVMDLFKELTSDETDDLLSACSQYLAGTQPTGPFQIYHQSFREFLRQSNEFSIYPVEANQAIADFFIQTYGDDWLSCDDKYALRYTRVHLQEAAAAADRPEDRRVRARIGEKLTALDRDDRYRVARIRMFSKGELAPPVESFISRVALGFVGRQWIFHRLDDWLESRESRHFLIVGGAGTGKSALAARLWQISRGLTAIDELSYPHLAPGFLTYAHFCQGEDQTSLNPLSFLEGLSRMLIYRYSDYARLYAGRVIQGEAWPAGGLQSDLDLDLSAVTINQDVLKTGPRAKINRVLIGRLMTGDPQWPLVIRHTLDELQLSKGVVVRDLVSRFRDIRHAADALLEPLTQLLRANPHLRFVVLLDGLDEAVHHSGNVLLDLLRLMNRLPEQVGLVLLSRPLPEVVETLGPAQIDLDKAVTENQQDILAYALDRLVSRPEAERQKLAKQTVNLYGTNFAAARVALDLLEPGAP